MVRPDLQKWSLSTQMLTELSITAPHPRTCERLLALLLLSQGSAFRCAWQLCRTLGRDVHTVHKCQCAVFPPWYIDIPAAHLPVVMRSLRCSARCLIKPAQTPFALSQKNSRPAAIHWTLRSLCSLVFCVCGLQVCRETLRKVLHSLGLSFKKAHKLLGKASPQKPAEFVHTLGELLQKAQQDDGPLLVFADEAHIHLDVEPGHGCAPRGQRLYVNSNSPGLGKKRTCFGLYLYGTLEPVQIHATDWATSDSTYQVLSDLQQAYPQKTLVLVWDNVRYHHGKQVH